MVVPKLMIRPLTILLIIIPIYLGAQDPWTTVTEGIPLPDSFRQNDGSIRGSRLFQLDDQVVVSVSSSSGRYALIATPNGFDWNIFPKALDANRFNVSTRLQNRRSFSPLDPVSDLRLQIPVGQTSRLEVTYRDSTGTFMAKGYPGESFEIPSPEATKTGDETSGTLEVIEAYFINFPDLPIGQITNLDLVDGIPIAQIGGQAAGSLYSWCKDCRSLELQGHWRTISGQSTTFTKPQRMAGGSTRGFILESLSESTVTEVRGNTFGVRHSIGAAPDDILNDIASDSDIFIAVGADFDFRTNTNGGLVARRIGTENWETSFIPGASEFLSISHGTPGWIATTVEGKIWSSVDGADWDILGSSPVPLVQMVEINGGWIASTEQGAVYRSGDLSNWAQELENFSGIRGIGVAGTHFLTYGQSGLLRSPSATDDFQSYQEWIDFHGIEEELSAPETSAAGDSFSNLFRYVARLSPLADAGRAFSKTNIYRDLETGKDYLSISIRTRPLPDGTRLLVEQSSSLTFEGDPAIEVGTPISHSDQTISRSFRTSRPVASTSKQFLRVHVAASTKD